VATKVAAHSWGCRLEGRPRLRPRPRLRLRPNRASGGREHREGRGGVVLGGGGRLGVRPGEPNGRGAHCKDGTRFLHGHSSSTLTPAPCSPTTSASRTPNRLMTEDFRRVASSARRDDEAYCC
jgi:hypothetical protein